MSHAYDEVLYSIIIFFTRSKMSLCVISYIFITMMQRSLDVRVECVDLIVSNHVLST